MISKYKNKNGIKKYQKQNHQNNNWTGRITRKQRKERQKTDQKEPVSPVLFVGVVFALYFLVFVFLFAMSFCFFSFNMADSTNRASRSQVDKANNASLLELAFTRRSTERPRRTPYVFYVSNIFKPWFSLDENWAFGSERLAARNIRGRLITLGHCESTGPVTWGEELIRPGAWVLPGATTCPSIPNDTHMLITAARCQGHWVTSIGWNHWKLVGGLEHIFHILGIIIPADSYLSEG